MGYVYRVIVWYDPLIFNSLYTIFEFLDLFGYEDEHMFEKPETPAVKRQRTMPASTDEDWFNMTDTLHKNIKDPLSQLLQIPLALNSAHPSKSLPANSTKIPVNPKGVLFPYIRHVHFTLHLLYEDFKLNTLYTECLLPLAKLLSKLSNDLGLGEFALHYWTDFPKDVVIGGPKIDDGLFKNINAWQGLSGKPVSVMEHIYRLLKGDSVEPYPYFTNVNVRSRNIVQVSFG